jgi:DNA repair exonuclease SbcCD ATPase subunit
VPIGYRIGVIDQDFNITHDEARSAISAAESLWEDATGRNLFTYDEDAEFTINFVFDERQEAANIEEDLRNKLDTKEDISNQVRDQYEDLLEQYDTLKSSYENKAAAYQDTLDAYNLEVERWNTSGGAPPEVYEALQEKQDELGTEQELLNTIASRLNEVVYQINTIGSEGNSLITDYNEIVEEYNEQFNESHEFTQGDYQGNLINIYQFDSEEELEIVIAHEFGHALKLGHVDGEESIMFHFMEEQTRESGVTAFDLHEFERVCGDDSFTVWSIL